MRIRTIKPEFWSHPILSRLPDSARLLAIGLLNLSDDEGYFICDPILVRNALRAFDEDSTRTREALDSLSKVGYILVSEPSEVGPIGFVVNFLKHQRIDRPTPSKLKCYFNSTSNRRGFDEGSLLEGNGKEGNGKERKQIAEKPENDDLELHLNGSGQEPKETKGKARDEATVVAYCKDQELSEEDGQWFWNKMLSSGWKNAGRAVADWKATVRMWKIGKFFPSQKNQPQPGAAVSKPQPLFVTIRNLKEAISVHPANPTWAGHSANKVTQEQRDDLRKLREKLCLAERQNLEAGLKEVA